MEKHERINIVLSIALLYVIITSIFSFLSRLSVLIITQGSLDKRLSIFSQRNTLWIIVVTGIIIVFKIYIKTSKQKVCPNTLDNSIVRLVTGTLVALEGVINLSSLLPLNIMSVMSAFQASKHMGGSAGGIIIQSVTSNVVSIAVILGQIFTGIYLAKIYSRKTD